MLLLDDIVARGRGLSQDEVEKRLAALDPETVMTLIYTSGTTGERKGGEPLFGGPMTSARASSRTASIRSKTNDEMDKAKWEMKKPRELEGWQLDEEQKATLVGILAHHLRRIDPNV